MKKRILFLSLSISLCALVLMTFFSTFIYRQNLVDNTVSHLKVYVLSYRQNRDKFDKLLSADKGSDAAKLLSEEIGGGRVTFIDYSGNVLGDSSKQNIGENHLDRKEVAAALSSGFGYSVRNSETVRSELIYYCEKYASPDVLVRVAVSSATVWDVLLDILPLLIVFILLDVGLCFALSAFAVRHVLRPVEAFGVLARESKSLPLSAPYRELEPLAGILTQLKRDSAGQMEEIKHEKMREAVVLENMEHGIAILKSVDDVLLINKAAAALLDFHEGDKVLYSVARDRELLELIEDHKNALLYRTYSRHDYAVRTSYVAEMEAMVVLITDVTVIRRAEKSKDDFIANVTHEMNTPLTAISGFAELIAGGRLTKAQTVKDAEIIASQSARLTKLVKSILNYSAIESEDTASETFSLSEMAKSAVAEYEGASKKRNVTVSFEGGGDIMLTAKKTRVKEVLDNFLSNAVRYNKDGGFVTVSVTQGAETNRPLLKVSDTGVGIAEENLDRIFDRFFTEDRSHSGEGFGLGLAIVKKLAKMSGWEISVHSVLGEGTTFSVLF